MRLSEQILAYTEGLPEGTPVAAKSLLQFGNRAAVDQALSRLAGRAQLTAPGVAYTFGPSQAGSARERPRRNWRSRRLPSREARSLSRTGPPPQMLWA